MQRHAPIAVACFQLRAVANEKRDHQRVTVQRRGVERRGDGALIIVQINQRQGEDARALVGADFSTRTLARPPA